MKRHAQATIVAALTLIAVRSTAATPAGGPLPDSLRPSRIAGSGINVIDLQAQRDWYQSRLGMKVVGSFPPGSDKPFEYVMSMSGKDDGQGAVLALLKTKRPDGPNGFSRVILIVPDPKGLADNLSAQGVAVRELTAGSVYFIVDPEGNNIELYRPPAK
jgi:catechol 2,3-dioxygenase-like lactoylglutathione lyase family enzyme